MKCVEQFPLDTQSANLIKNHAFDMNGMIFNYIYFRSLSKLRWKIL